MVKRGGTKKRKLSQKAKFYENNVYKFSGDGLRWWGN